MKFQSYLDDDELRDKWGEKFEEYSDKINECVSEVIGQYLEYDGEPIMACFHALSTGKTESAKKPVIRFPLPAVGKDVQTKYRPPALYSFFRRKR